MRTVFSLFKQTFTEWQEDKAPMLAAALAYYTVFSLSPLLIILIAVLAFLGQWGLLGDGSAQSLVLGQAGGLLGEDGAALLRNMIQNRANDGGNAFATLIGFLLILVGATGLFTQLQNALNIIWDVEPSKESGFLHLIKVRVTSLGMILAIGFLLLVSLVLTAVLEGLAASTSGLPGADSVWIVFNWLVSLGGTALLFALIFKVLPDISLSWRSVWVGASVTALLFVIGKQLLGLYLSRPALSSSYGAAGSLVVLLLWVFYSAQILLFGGEFTQVYARRFGLIGEPKDVSAGQMSDRNPAPHG